ncbi:MAG: nucleotidyltransferase domain-containing protein [Caulobacter sp.]|nr:nucleotidyltransferase domain-containing protein [Caulobacter sp.]
MAAFRAIPDDLSPAAVAGVDAMLAAIRQDDGVHIPLAIESGSRAWGFPSPDSDYDCRFIYVRPARQHLTVWPRRDVIERPISDELDVNGWDLAKALRLALKGNAVVIEWLQSPIAYCVDPVFRDDLLAFAERFTDRTRLASHYLHLARRQVARHLVEPQNVALKKIFYALRPAAALRWLRLHPDRTLPPMHFPTLMGQGDLSSEVRDLVDDLMAQKAVSREMGTGLMPAPILAFVQEELDRAAGLDVLELRRVTPQARSAADKLFEATTLRLDSSQRTVAPPTELASC